MQMKQWRKVCRKYFCLFFPIYGKFHKKTATIEGKTNHKSIKRKSCQSFFFILKTDCIQEIFLIKCLERLSVKIFHVEQVPLLW